MKDSRATVHRTKEPNKTSAATCGELSREKDRGSTFVTRAARLFDLPCGGHHARTAGSTRGCYYVRADLVVRFSTSVGFRPKTPTRPWNEPATTPRCRWWSGRVRGGGATRLRATSYTRIISFSLSAFSCMVAAFQHAIGNSKPSSSPLD